jgi:hypothetical protein
MYNPTAEEAERDRRDACDSGVPHGMRRLALETLLRSGGHMFSIKYHVTPCVPGQRLLPGAFAGFVATGDKYSSLPTLPLLVVSELVSCETLNL